MPVINLAYIAELVFRYARKAFYLFIIASFWLAISAMWTSFVAGIIFFYNLLSNFFNLATTGAGASSNLLDKMFGILHCIGFVDGFNANKAVLISAITFLLARILFKFTLRTYRYFFNSFKPLVN